MYESWSSGWGRCQGRSVTIPTPKVKVDGPPRSKSNPKLPSCYCSSSGERAQDDHYPPLYVAHEARDDVHRWFKGCVIEHYTSSEALSVGNKWWETGHTCKVQACKDHTTEFWNFRFPGCGQQAAHDTYIYIRRLKGSTLRASFSDSYNSLLVSPHATSIIAIIPVFVLIPSWLLWRFWVEILSTPFLCFLPWGIFYHLCSSSVC